jgi:poly(3-hydroxybutyrate) depolymerase
MLARHLAALTLIVSACGDTSDGGDTDAATEGSSSTAAEDTGGTPPATTSPDPTDTAGSTGNATGVSTGNDDTGAGSDGSGGSDSTGGQMVGSPGCMAETPLAEGEHTFMLDGIERRYIVRLPSNYSPDQPWPLIFALHGNGGNPGYWDATGGDRDIRTAFAEEAILIIPEAINNQWRDYSAPADTWPAGIVLELNFFDSVYDTAQNELCIDTTNVFSMGFSGGGSFSGVLGCQRDYIRAIAVGGSVIYFDEADCTSTPAAWITIGEQEYTDGRAAFRDFFADHAGCQMTSTPGAPDGCVDYDGCGAGTPVTYCSHPADHVWPSIGTDATKAFFQGFYAGG